MTWFGNSTWPGRRHLFQMLVSGALAGLIRPGLGHADTLELSDERFLALSERLCGIAPSDPSLAGAVQAAVAPLYPPGTLVRIADVLEATQPGGLDFAIAAAGLTEPASRIVAVWYSGLIYTGTGARVLTYTSALGWAATGFAKPAATCDTGFGAWSDVPPVARL